MSPEQVQSSKDVDHRTDLWSLGSALYCALAGRAPFSHVESVVKLILAICGSAPPKIRDRAPWVPGEVAAVVDRALATDRDRRYPSAAAMLDAIRALLPDGFALREEALVGLSPEARSRHVVSTGGGSEVSGDGATVAQDTRAGSPATRARTVAILALLLGAGAAALYASRPGPSPRAAAPSASEPPAPATAPAPAAPATASAEPSAQAPRGAPPPPPAPVTGPAPRKPPVPPAPRPSAAPSARPDASKPGGGFF
jgi:serine/threonine-protein kinase